MYFLCSWLDTGPERLHLGLAVDGMTHQVSLCTPIIRLDGWIDTLLFVL